MSTSKRTRVEVFESFEKRFADVVIPAVERVKKLKTQIDRESDTVRAEVKSIKEDLFETMGSSDYLYVVGTETSRAIKMGDTITDITVSTPFKLFLNEEDAKQFVTLCETGHLVIRKTSMNNISLLSMFRFVEKSFDVNDISLPDTPLNLSGRLETE